MIIHCIINVDCRGSAVQCSAGHVLSKSAKETKAFSAVSACSPLSSTYVASVEMSTITGANDHAPQPVYPYMNLYIRIRMQNASDRTMHIFM